MNVYITIVFGILGIGLGFLIPLISNKIVIYKNRKRSRETVALRFDSTLLKVLLAILNGFLWLSAGISFVNIFTALSVSLLFTVAIIISVIDLRIRLIPNELVLVMFCLGTVFQILNFGWSALLPAVICMVVVGLVFMLVGGVVGLDQVGAGDVKLAAAMGLTLGYPNIMICLVGMSAALLVFCLTGLVTKKLTLHSLLAFAPFMMFGTISALVYIIVKI